MADVDDGVQTPHKESDTSVVTTPSIFETDAPGTASLHESMLVASDSFENLNYDPLDTPRSRLGSGIIGNLSGKKNESLENINDEAGDDGQEGVSGDEGYDEKQSETGGSVVEAPVITPDLPEETSTEGLGHQGKVPNEKNDVRPKDLPVGDKIAAIGQGDEDVQTEVKTESHSAIDVTYSDTSTLCENEERVCDKEEEPEPQETSVPAEVISNIEEMNLSSDSNAGGNAGPNWMRMSADTISDGEDVNHPAWRHHKKHVFILSEAGKPVYSRFGNEDNLVTLMGVMQALVSFVTNSEKDSIRCIVAGDHRFVFLLREHLFLVGVSRGPDSTHQLLLQLSYVYNQIISVLTLSQLAKIFKQRHNFDLRRLLSGAEKFIDNLLNMMDSEPGFLLGAVRCLPLEGSIRDTIAQAIVQHCKVKDLVFALIIASSQLVTLVRMKKYFLHPVDLHLIINLVNASESFKAAESWTPICLPKFDSSGFLQAHVSYLDESCQTCLFLLTVDRDSFFTLSDCKSKIKQKLQKSNCLQAISDSLSRNSYSIKQCAISGLRHFLYKSRNSAQYTSPELEAPYLSQEEQDRLFGLYQYLHHRIHSSSRPLKLLYHVGAHETLIGWITQGFELYAVFGPLVTKTIAIQAINKLLRWIKKEENRLFILSSFTF
ncbi:protein SAND [Octopus sinensis]|uniref:Vacuolar fusion protein MON1 homolog n=1 Tax=Octopus sinensis TaxID=2607531 RepID=A0A6P7SGW5_9MOLL|nr:protein SAND [Octopus sinensis]